VSKSLKIRELRGLNLRDGISAASNGTARVCKIFPPTVRASVEAKAIPVKSYELALPGLPA
jgi:hypothetical protein